MIIETQRLFIRPLAPSDAQEVQVAKEEAWPELQMWMSWAYDHMLPRAALDDYIANVPPEHPWDAAIAFSKEDGCFAVMGGLHRGAQGEGDFGTGYWCARTQRGKGYATEMTNALIRYAFRDLAARQVRISYYQDNTPSRRVIEKLGFAYTHTVKGGHNRCLDGTPLDVHHYIVKDPSALPPLEWQLVSAE